MGQPLRCTFAFQDLPSPAVGEGGVDNDCSAAGGSVASPLQQAAALQDTDSALQWQPRLG